MACASISPTSIPPSGSGNSVSPSSLSTGSQVGRGLSICSSVRRGSRTSTGPASPKLATPTTTRPAIGLRGGTLSSAQTASSTMAIATRTAKKSHRTPGLTLGSVSRYNASGTSSTAISAQLSRVERCRRGMARRDRIRRTLCRDCVPGAITTGRKQQWPVRKARGGPVPRVIDSGAQPSAYVPAAT